MGDSKSDPTQTEFSGLEHFALAMKGEKAWNTLCRALRNGVRSQTQTDSSDDTVSVNHHARILEMIRFGLIHDNPAHIVFPGSKDSFIQMSAEFTCPRAYTVCIWLKVDEDTAMKGFLLCRCRCPTGGLDVILSERQTDGKWLVTMEGSADGPNFSSAASNFEVKGSVYISHGKWHLLSIRHQSSYTRSPKVSFVVDGNLEFENELPYPFLNALVESQWLFGLRFKGLLASATLYPEEVSVPLLSLLYNKGPHMHSLVHGVVGIPQASFDTGHVILGTQIAKGPSASEACCTVPSFCITPNHFIQFSNLPQCPPGRQNVDLIEMTPRLMEDSSAEGNLLLPSMTGGCQLGTRDGVNSSRSWAESWLTAGGCPLLLYLLQEYVRALPNPTTPIVKVTTDEPVADYMTLIRQTICLLATLIESSAELKEQFIQIHGFHVVSSCLSQIQGKNTLVTKDVVDCCVELTLSLGLDALRGDGIAAALQGLLLDFRIWGDCSDGVKLYLLNSIANVVASTGDQLYSNVGLQRLLDVFRLHICTSNTEGVSASEPSSEQSNTDCSTGEPSDLKLECANACARLLFITVDAGLTVIQKSGSTATPFYSEAEMLYACLEETSSYLLAERILRVLSSLRTTAPAALLHAMVETRFAETTAIGLLTNPIHSTEVRRETVTNILWALGEQLKHIPQQLALSRRGGYNGSTSRGRSFIGKRGQAEIVPPASTAHDKIAHHRESQWQLAQRTLIRPLERAWYITSMLAEVMGIAIKDGNWQGKGKDAKSTADTVSEVLIAFSHDGPLGTVHAWLVLPMLPILFTYGHFRCNLRALMSLNVLIKTDDTQSVALTALPDRAWVRLFVSIALTGERGRQRSLLKAKVKEMEDEKDSREAGSLDITSGYSVVDAKECSAALAKDEVNWALEAEIAATVTELALDAASTVLEGKMRHNGSESWSTWNCLQNCLKSGCKTFNDEAEDIEISFLKRCVSVVIQRLARSSEVWTVDTLKGVTNILTFVENRKLCGNTPVVTPGSKKIPPSKGSKPSPVPAEIVSKVALIEMDSHALGRRSQNADELQIMCFLTDLLSSLRKSIERNGLVGDECSALKIGFNIILGCLSSTSEIGADKISKEIFDQLCFMSEGYSTCTADAFKDFIMLIFSNLQQSVNDETISEELTGRYCALVYLIMHHFLDIRHKIASGEAVSAHVLPALDALAGVDTAKDVKLIFRLLEVCMRTADTISFADVSSDEMEHMVDGEMDRSGNTAISESNAENRALPNGSYANSRDNSPSRLREAGSKVHHSAAHHDDGDSLHSMDILMVDMDEFQLHGSVFGEPDSYPTDHATSLSQTKPENTSVESKSVPTRLVPLLAVGDGTEDRVNGSDATRGIEGSLFADPSVANSSSQITVADKESTVQEDLLQLQTEGSDYSLSPASASDAFSPIVVSVTPPNGEQIREVTPGTPRNKTFFDWVKVRRGISLVRTDTERARLVRTSEALELAAEATDKFWVKLVRKIESESFNDAHDCQWKLGVSHESFFPGRRRVVLRPRFDINNNEAPPCDEGESRERAENLGRDDRVEDDEFKTLDSPFGDFGEVKAALAKALGSLINDITQSGPTDSLYIATSTTAEDTHKRSGPDSNTSNSPKAETKKSSGTTAVQPGVMVAPGSGWGLVDADGSDEGYDVVGLEMGDHGAQSAEGDSSPVLGGKVEGHEGAKKVSGPVAHSSSKPNATSGSATNDRQGDVRLVEAQLKEGKDAVETGPCHSGTKKAGSGPTILRSRVIMVTASGNFWGSLSFNGREVFFTSSFEPEDGHKEDNAAVNLQQQLRMRRRRWTLASVCAIYLRRYRLRDTAMEIFFRRGKHRNFFVDFGHTREDERHRQAFARALMDVAPPGCFKQWPSMSPFRLVPELGVQEKWVSGRMSNFDYLMALNTISGRSFNDLCQYPVMPWIIAQYEKDTIDLHDPATFRDLSKPVGALNETRLKDFLERFHSFGEQLSSGGSSTSSGVGSGCRDSIPAFMYGSHYSTMMGVVLHFLVRLQPFASLHKEMQSGHFDVPDRLFSSIPRSYKHNTTQLSEVKELTPEWFTTPEMFRNVNNFNFGQTQDGDAVGDVMLPPWASTAEEFVRINREAMESDYVSDHLQEWIDLIFGYKQRGPAAVEANNVFYYLTYSGSVNRDVIINESLRRATELQIAHFGQIPMQLFRTPHPPKRTCGSMGNGSIAGAMHAAPRPLRKNFVATATLPAVVVPGVVVPPNLGSEISMQRSMSIEQVVHDTITLNPTVDGSIPVSVTPPVLLKASERLLQDGLAFPENDEEAVAVESPCTLVLRPFAQPVNVSPSQRLRTVLCPGGRGRKVAFESLGSSYVPPSTILSLCVLPDRLIVVLGTGVVEAYRYYTSDAAKSVLIMTAALPPQNRRSYISQRRRNVQDVARKNKAIKTAQAEAQALLDSSVLERELADKPLISFLDEVTEGDATASAESEQIRLEALRLNPLWIDPSTETTPSTSHITESKNKNSSLRGTLQTSSTPPKQDNPDRVTLDLKESAAVLEVHEKGNLRGSSVPPTAPPSTQNTHRRILSKKEPLVCVERDSSHFEVLPRLPLTKLLLCRNGPVSPTPPPLTASASLSSVSTTATTQSSSVGNGMSSSSSNLLRPATATIPKSIQSSSLYALEQAASLVVFSRSGRLALTAGRVDGSIAVREVDPRTGFILSAADFRAHHHRVICLACDSITLARTDVIASCDAFGQTLVWNVFRSKTLSQPSGYSSYLISRRPQRLFRCEPSQHMRCEISWQLGLVVTVSMGVVHIFSVERDERLRAFEYEWEEEIIVSENEQKEKEKETEKKSTDGKLGEMDLLGDALGGHSEGSLSEHGSADKVPVEFEVNKKDFNKSDKTNISGLSSTYRKRGSKGSNSAGEGGEPSEECSIARRIALCDDGVIILHIEVTNTREETESKKKADAAEGHPGDTTPSPSKAPETEPTAHYIVSYSISGVRIGRLRMASPVTFLSVPDRGSDVVITGSEDGAVSIFRASDLALLYRCYPHLESTPQPQINTSFPNPFSGPQSPPVPPNSSKTPSRAEGNLNNAILCVRAGPSPDTPSVLCISAASGALYVRPLPDFVRWERTRIPSALSQLVNAPIQAVRGSIQHAQTYAAEAAGVMAENAKMFVAEKMEKMNKSKVMKFFGFGQK